MKRKYVMVTTHKKMRGFEYLAYSAFSLILLVVLVCSPLAPVFADTDNALATTEIIQKNQTEGPLLYSF